MCVTFPGFYTQHIDKVWELRRRGVETNFHARLENEVKMKYGGSSAAVATGGSFVHGTCPSNSSGKTDTLICGPYCGLTAPGLMRILMTNSKATRASLCHR